MIEATKLGVVVPFVTRPFALQRALLREPAALSQVLARIELELAPYAGKNNGKIICTYGDLRNIGFGARMLDRLEDLGIVRIKRGRSGVKGFERPNLFRLTYLPTWNGKKWLPATNDWLTKLPVNGERFEITRKKSSKSPKKGLKNSFPVVPVQDHCHVVPVEDH